MPSSMPWGWEERDGGWTESLRPKMDKGGRDAMPVEFPSWRGGGSEQTWGARPQVQAEGEETCSRDWRGIAGLRVDMGEGAIRTEIRGEAWLGYRRWERQ